MNELKNINILTQEIEDELNQNGYIVVPGLEKSKISYYLSEAHNLLRNIDTDKYNFNTASDFNHSIRTHTFQRIAKDFTPILNEIFFNFEIIMGIIFIKRPSPDTKSQVGLHFDPTLLPNENIQRHLNVWVPLIDVDEKNGALWVVPRSHKIFAPAHAITITFPFSNIQNSVFQYGKCIKMKAGEALIFDNRLIHYSLQNFSKIDRPSIVLSFVPPESTFISLYKENLSNSLIEVYHQSHNWYQHPDWSNNFERPKTGNFIGYLNYEPRLITETEFNYHLTSGEPFEEYNFELKM